MYNEVVDNFTYDDGKITPSTPSTPGAYDFYKRAIGRHNGRIQ